MCMRKAFFTHPSRRKNGICKHHDTFPFFSQGGRNAADEDYDTVWDFLSARCTEAVLCDEDEIMNIRAD